MLISDSKHIEALILDQVKRVAPIDFACDAFEIQLSVCTHLRQIEYRSDCRAVKLWDNSFLDSGAAPFLGVDVYLDKFIKSMAVLVLAADRVDGVIDEEAHVVGPLLDDDVAEDSLVVDVDPVDVVEEHIIHYRLRL